MKASAGLVLAAMVLASAAGPAPAQSWPARPVRLLVGFTPGAGSTSTPGCLPPGSAKLSDSSSWWRTAPAPAPISPTRPSPKRRPTATHCCSPAPRGDQHVLYRNPPFDALRDFTPVSVFSDSTNILVVNASLPANSARELVELAQAKPGTLNYSSAGSGSTQHLAGELFKLRTGTKIVHVPYKGSAPALTALISGDVQLAFVNPVAIGQHVKSGRMRALAVAGARRSALMPDVPTLREAGRRGRGSRALVRRARALGHADGRHPHPGQRRHRRREHPGRQAAPAGAGRRACGQHARRNSARRSARRWRAGRGGGGVGGEGGLTCDGLGFHQVSRFRCVALLQRIGNARSKVFVDQGAVADRPGGEFDVMASRHFAALQPRNAAEMTRLIKTNESRVV